MSIDPTEFFGRTSSVTGGSRGLGAAIASQLAAGGANV
jgi:NAD(P)-dependent dehydrogenase (short-subunit alcohol dehydrogenase family)